MCEELDLLIQQLCGETETGDHYGEPAERFELGSTDDGSVKWRIADCLNKYKQTIDLDDPDKVKRAELTLKLLSGCPISYNFLIKLVGDAVPDDDCILLLAEGQQLTPDLLKQHKIYQSKSGQIFRWEDEKQKDRLLEVGDIVSAVTQREVIIDYDLDFDGLNTLIDDYRNLIAEVRRKKINAVLGVNAVNVDISALDARQLVDVQIFIVEIDAQAFIVEVQAPIQALIQAFVRIVTNVDLAEFADVKLVVAVLSEQNSESELLSKLRRREDFKLKEKQLKEHELRELFNGLVSEEQRTAELSAIYERLITNDAAASVVDARAIRFVLREVAPDVITALDSQTCYHGLILSPVDYSLIKIPEGMTPLMVIVDVTEMGVDAKQYLAALIRRTPINDLFVACETREQCLMVYQHCAEAGLLSMDVHLYLYHNKAEMRFSDAVATAYAQSIADIMPSFSDFEDMLTILHKSLDDGLDNWVTMASEMKGRVLAYANANLRFNESKGRYTSRRCVASKNKSRNVNALLDLFSDADSNVEFLLRIIRSTEFLKGCIGWRSLIPIINEFNAKVFEHQNLLSLRNIESEDMTAERIKVFLCDDKMLGFLLQREGVLARIYKRFPVMLAEVAASVRYHHPAFFFTATNGSDLTSEILSKLLKRGEQTFDEWNQRRYQHGWPILFPALAAKPGLLEADYSLEPAMRFQYEDSEMLLGQWLLRNDFVGCFVHQVLGDEPVISDTAHTLFYMLLAIPRFDHFGTEDENAVTREIEAFREVLEPLVGIAVASNSEKPIILCGIINFGGNHYVPYFVHCRQAGTVQLITLDASARAFVSIEPIRAAQKYQDIFTRVLSSHDVQFHDADVAQQLCERDCGPNSLQVIRDALSTTTTEQPLLQVDEQGVMILDAAQLSVNGNNCRYIDPRNSAYWYDEQLTLQTHQMREEWNRRLSLYHSISAYIPDLKSVGEYGFPADMRVEDIETAYNFTANANQQSNDDLFGEVQSFYFGVLLKLLGKGSLAGTIEDFKASDDPEFPSMTYLLDKDDFLIKSQKVFVTRGAVPGMSQEEKTAKQHEDTEKLKQTRLYFRAVDSNHLTEEEQQARRKFCGVLRVALINVLRDSAEEILLEAMSTQLDKVQGIRVLLDSTLEAYAETFFEEFTTEYSRYFGMLAAEKRSELERNIRLSIVGQANTMQRTRCKEYVVNYLNTNFIAVFNSIAEDIQNLADIVEIWVRKTTQLSEASTLIKVVRWLVANKAVPVGALRSDASANVWQLKKYLIETLLTKPGTNAVSLRATHTEKFIQVVNGDLVFSNDGYLRALSAIKMSGDDAPSGTLSTFSTRLLMREYLGKNKNTLGNTFKQRVMTLLQENVNEFFRSREWSDYLKGMTVETISTIYIADDVITFFKQVYLGLFPEGDLKHHLDLPTQVSASMQIQMRNMLNNRFKALLAEQAHLSVDAVAPPILMKHVMCIDAVILDDAKATAMPSMQRVKGGSADVREALYCVLAYEYIDRVASAKRTFFAIQARIVLLKTQIIVMCEELQKLGIIDDDSTLALIMTSYEQAVIKWNSVVLCVEKYDDFMTEINKKDSSSLTYLIRNLLHHICGFAFSGKTEVNYHQRAAVRLFFLRVYPTKFACDTVNRILLDEQFVPDTERTIYTFPAQISIKDITPQAKTKLILPILEVPVIEPLPGTDSVLTLRNLLIILRCIETAAVSYSGEREWLHPRVIELINRLGSDLNRPLLDDEHKKIVNEWLRQALMSLDISAFSKFPDVLTIKVLDSITHMIRKPVEMQEDTIVTQGTFTTLLQYLLIVSNPKGATDAAVLFDPYSLTDINDLVADQSLHLLPPDEAKTCDIPVEDGEIALSIFKDRQPEIDEVFSLIQLGLQTVIAELPGADSTSRYKIPLCLSDFMKIINSLFTIWATLQRTMGWTPANLLWDNTSLSARVFVVMAKLTAAAMNDYGCCVSGYNLMLANNLRSIFVPTDAITCDYYYNTTGKRPLYSSEMIDEKVDYRHLVIDAESYPHSIRWITDRYGLVSAQLWNFHKKGKMTVATLRCLLAQNSELCDELRKRLSTLSADKSVWTVSDIKALETYVNKTMYARGISGYYNWQQNLAMSQGASEFRAHLDSQPPTRRDALYATQLKTTVNGYRDITLRSILTEGETRCITQAGQAAAGLLLSLNPKAKLPLFLAVKYRGMKIKSSAEVVHSELEQAILDSSRQTVESEAAEHIDVLTAR